LFFWLAATVGGLSGWAINLFIYFTPYVLYAAIAGLFFVPALVAVLSYGLLSGFKQIGRSLGSNLGGMAGLVVGLPFLVVSSVIKIGNGRATLFGFFIIFVINIGGVLTNLVAGMFFGFLIRLYYRIRYGNRHHRSHTSHHHSQSSH
jgi:hypothetical protein